MKTRKTLMRGLVALLLAAPMVHAQFTWNGTSNLSGTQTYDGLGVDSGLDPYTFGSTSANSYIGFGNTGVLNVHSGSLTWINGNPNIGRSSGGNGTVNVDAGASLTINNNGTWGSSIGHAGATGVLNIGDGASMTWILSGNNEQRLMVGNGTSGNGTINLNGGTMSVSNDVAETLDDNDRGFRVGSDGGIGTLNLNGGTLSIGASSFALDGGFSSMNSTPVFNDGNSGTLNINDGDLVFNGSTVIGFGANAVINFTSWGLGKLSLLGYTSSDYLALASAGNLQIDGATQADLSNFTFSTEGSQGVLTANDIVPSAPAAPTNVAASVSVTNVTLSWDSTFGIRYKIYRSDSSGSGYSEVGDQYASPFQDVISGTKYYVIKAYRTGGSLSPYSDEVVATEGAMTPPDAPEWRLMWMNGTTAKLFWNTVSGADAYVIQRATSEGGPYATVAVTNPPVFSSYQSDSRSYYDTNLVAGTTYFYKVAASNSAGVGESTTNALSGTATVTRILGDFELGWHAYPEGAKEAAFDGVIETACDHDGNGGWVGLDCATNRDVVAVKFYPRSGSAARMGSGYFQGATMEDFSDAETLYTLPSSAPTYEWHTVGVSPSSPYRYYRFVSSGGYPCNVAEIEFLTAADLPSDPPATPANVVGYVYGQDSMYLGWDSASNAISGYNVYRSTDDITYSFVTNVLGSTSYTDTGLAADATYYYAISASNVWSSGAKESALSAVVSGKTSQYAVFGSTTSIWQNNPAGTYYATFDGDPETSFDANDADAWSAVDFGAPKTVVGISYIPRSGSESRMTSVVFDISTDASFGTNQTIEVLYDVPDVTPAPVWYYIPVTGASAMQYARMHSVSGHGNCGELIFHTDATEITANGTPKAWLDLYGLVSGGNYEAASTADFDHDGASNHDELVAGTDPTDGASVFAVAFEGWSTNSELMISWPTVQGKSYSVMTNNNLQASGSWTSVTNVVGDGSINYHAEAISGDIKFLNVEVQ